MPPDPKAPKGRVLFLAQLPPPHHGQSAMAAAVHRILAGEGDLAVVHRWRGGARGATDVGRRSLGKYLGFAWLVAGLLADLVTLRRYDIAYVGMAPWAHTAMRDAFLAGFAKLLARRVWVHVHGEGLAPMLQGRGIANRIARRLLVRTELLAITAETARTARLHGRFSRVVELPNVAPDPGPPPAARDGALTISCLGNLDPRKGVVDFVDILAALADKGHPVRGLIVGGETAFLSLVDIRRRIRDRGAEGLIEATGRVPEEQKSAILHETDVFLYLSRHDLAPVAVIEALAHGAAPIVLGIGGLSEMVGAELQGNVLTLGREAPLEAQVETIVATYVADRARLEADRQAARRRYLAAYSPDRFRERILSHLAGERPSPMPLSRPRFPARPEKAL